MNRQGAGIDNIFLEGDLESLIKSQRLCFNSHFPRGNLFLGKMGPRYHHGAQGGALSSLCGITCQEPDVGRGGNVVPQRRVNSRCKLFCGTLATILGGVPFHSPGDGQGAEGRGRGPWPPGEAESLT